MIAENASDREIYEARLMRQRDEEAFLRAAREDGIAEGVSLGRSTGILIGKIQMLQEILGLPASPDEELESRSHEELLQLKAELQQRHAASAD